MVYRILNIAASILLGFCALAFAACLVFTIASPIVQQGFDNIGEAVESLVSQATDAMAPPSNDSDNSGSREPGIIERIGEFFSGFFTFNSNDQITVVSTPLSQDGATLALSGPSLSDFDNAYVGQLYLGWRNTVADPLSRVLLGSGIDTEVIEGVAAGSNTARRALLECSDTALDLISANVSTYRTSVVTAKIPDDLSGHTKVQMSAANTAALEFCDAAQTFLDDARAAHHGSAQAEGMLSGHADDVIQALNDMKEAMTQAEATLGVSR